MKIQLLVLISSFILISLNGFSHADAKPDDQILGVWWSPKKDGRIKIVRSGDLFEGSIIWSIPEKVDQLDTKNPDKSLRHQKVLGLKFLTGFKFDGEKWIGGKIYDPNNGETYSSIIKLKDSRLHVRGYIGVSLFGRTEIFERYNEE